MTVTGLASEFMSGHRDWQPGWQSLSGRFPVTDTPGCSVKIDRSITAHRPGPGVLGPGRLTMPPGRRRPRLAAAPGARPRTEPARRPGRGVTVFRGRLSETIHTSDTEISHHSIFRTDGEWRCCTIAHAQNISQQRFVFVRNTQKISGVPLPLCAIKTNSSCFICSFRL